MSKEVVSSFFASESQEDDIADDFLHLMDELNYSLNEIKLPSSIVHVYNPTIYARETFEMYVKKYCNTSKRIMYFGMNPGPWGMSQTGVPFGEISSVKEWLEIEGHVEKPEKENRARPVDGFQCTRVEISGKRFWGLFKMICNTPENFFKSSFVYNYLPQQWMKANGCNITPGDFKMSDMQELYSICDPVFIKILKLYRVEVVVCIGKFCETRAQKALQKYLPSSSIQILYLPHPSPRSVNNNDWEQKARKYLEKYDLLKFYDK